MTDRTIAVWSGVGAPFALISAKAAPTTSAAMATAPQSSDTWRGLLQKNRDCDRSGVGPA